MPAIGMPGPCEWVIILVFLAVLAGGVVLLVRARRGGGPPHGFDIGPAPVPREGEGDDGERR